MKSLKLILMNLAADEDSPKTVRRGARCPSQHPPAKCGSRGRVGREITFVSLHSKGSSSQGLVGEVAVLEWSVKSTGRTRVKLRENWKLEAAS